MPADMVFSFCNQKSKNVYIYMVITDHVLETCQFSAGDTMDVVKSTNRDEDCRVFMGFNKYFVTLHSPHFPHSADAALLFPILLPTYNSEARSKNMTCRPCKQPTTVDESVNL
jgi:hypothetical protein